MGKSCTSATRKVILAVEDNPELGRFYQYALEDDYDIIVVQSGEDAFNKLTVMGTVDLMMLDLRLPGMSGMDVLDKMKKFFPAVPVLIVSANRLGDGISRQTAFGTYEYLEKPFNVNDLMDKIKKRIDSVH